MTGHDTNSGTMASPGQDHRQGHPARRAARPQKDVYVSKGVYPEMVKMVSGVSLYGGYDASNDWQRVERQRDHHRSPDPIGVLAE